MSEHSHIIEKVNIEVDVADIKTAHYVRDNVREFLYGSVFPKLETMFDGIGAKGVDYRTTSISLDLQFDSQKNFDEKFAGRLLERLEEIIVAGDTSASVRAKQSIAQESEKVFEAKSAGEKPWEVFLYFLKTGNLPWFAVRGQSWLAEDELLQFIKSSSINWKASFNTLIRYDTVAIRRFIRQFDIRFIVSFIEKYLEQDVISYEEFLQVSNLVSMPGDHTQVFRLFLFELLRLLSKEVAPVTLTPAVYKEVADKAIGRHTQITEGRIAERAQEGNIKERPQASLQDKAESETSVKKPADETESIKEGLFVSNAGLVLLHPFLQYFFKELQLLDGKEFLNSDTQQTAVHLLHYLATGKEQSMEYDMAMEKYLCGMYVHEPIERFVALSDKMKEECTQLLQAVVGHWKALKSTSSDGLREAFLQRNGKLVSGDGREHLIVESMSIDILLDKLPWSFSIMQLPWMKNILYVEWLLK